MEARASNPDSVILQMVGHIGEAQWNRFQNAGAPSNFEFTVPEAAAVEGRRIFGANYYDKDRHISASRMARFAEQEGLDLGALREERNAPSAPERPSAQLASPPPPREAAAPAATVKEADHPVFSLSREEALRQAGPDSNLGKVLADTSDRAWDQMVSRKDATLLIGASTYNALDAEGRQGTMNHFQYAEVPRDKIISMAAELGISGRTLNEQNVEQAPSAVAMGGDAASLASASFAEIRGQLPSGSKGAKIMDTIGAREWDAATQEDGRIRLQPDDVDRLRQQGGMSWQDFKLEGHVYTISTSAVAEKVAGDIERPSAAPAVEPRAETARASDGTTLGLSEKEMGALRSELLTMLDGADFSSTVGTGNEATRRSFSNPGPSAKDETTRTR